MFAWKRTILKINTEDLREKAKEEEIWYPENLKGI